MMAHIFLYGPPGSGKSTLGSLLAESLQLPFVDLDQAVQMRAGMTIAQLIDAGNESSFRDAESSVLQEQLRGPDSVIALGGGALLRAGNRTLVEDNGTVVCLTAEPEALLRRLEADSTSRPLLTGNAAARLASLLDARREHYNSFPLQVYSDGSPETLVPRLQAATGRFHLNAMGSYDVVVEAGALERLGTMLRARGVQQPFIVTDEHVAECWAAQVADTLRRSSYDATMLLIPAGETSKTLDTVSRLWDGFFRAGLDRKSTVIALGGGVVGDLAGFAAATFMRGIDWVNVPTSLLAMADASLGGKTGFDLPEGKNLVGAFHPPRLVLADPNVLSTLPRVEFRAGLAEVLKHGIVADAELFEGCAHGLPRVQQSLHGILRRAVAAKVHIIEADPYEQDGRAALNLGHTVGHAVELVSGFRVRHGEAVAMGLVAEARLSERLGMARAGLSTRIAAALSGLGLPVQIPQELPVGELVRGTYADKKKADGVVRFTLPVEVGRVRVNVEVADPRLAFEES